MCSYRLERCQGAGCTSFAQIATPTAATFNDTTSPPPTTYTYRVRATDAANNLSPYSTTATATTSAAAGGFGPVAAYPFDATSGTSASDVSGNGFTGTLVGASWAAADKFANALAFTGSSAYVSIR